MVFRYINILTVAAVVFIAASVPAETSFEFGLNTGYTDNLFNDSTKILDSYTAPYAGFKVYPSSSVEISATGQYTTYNDIPDLGSLYGSGNITYVKADNNHPLSFFLSTSVSIKDYGELYCVYDNMHWGASAKLGYRLSPYLHLITGGDVLIGNYSNSATGDNRGFGFYTGINATLPGKNTIDIEGGAEFTAFDGLETLYRSGTGPRSELPDLKNELQTFYSSARFSRPIGKSTELNVEYAFRSFIGDDDVVTYGLSLDNLSPWTAFWEGQEVSANLKSKIIAGFEISTAFQYRQSRYMDALESDNFMGPETSDGFSVQMREDNRYHGSLILRRPYTLNPGLVITPVIHFAYTDNTSTLPFYDCSSLVITAAIDFSF
jgi:hypothetical protein